MQTLSEMLRVAGTQLVKTRSAVVIIVRHRITYLGRRFQRFVLVTAERNEFVNAGKLETRVAEGARHVLGPQRSGPGAKGRKLSNARLTIAAAAARGRAAVRRMARLALCQ
jgi:hypothetical protein